MPFRLLFALRAVLTGLSLAVLGGTGPAPALTVTENAQAMGPGFTHQLKRLLIDDRAGRFPFGATGDEQHDRGLGGVLHGA